MINTNQKRFFNLISLSFAGSTIYELAYLSYSYYDVMLDSFGISNSQMGALMSIFGMVAAMSYFPGGWIADRFSSKKLIVLSLLMTGGLGLWEMRLPSFHELVIIYFLWGISVTFTFWAPLLKATGQLGSSNEQGKLFGGLEAGRGMIPMLYGLIIVAAYQSVNGKAAGLQRVILLYSILNIIAAMIIIICMKEDKQDILRNNKKDLFSKDVILLVKKPEIWLIAGIVFVSYCTYISFSYITPFLINYCNVSSSAAAVAAIVRTYGIAVVGGIFSGYMADKIGSRIKMLCYSFTVGAVGIGIFLTIRSCRGQLLIIGAILVTGLGIFMTRSLYFAVIDDIHIERRMVGLAIGMVSVIGFLPEIFIYPLIGSWLDQYHGEKPYIMIFMLMLVCSLIGLGFSVFMLVILSGYNRRRI